jgi:hypothetical protein
MASRGEWIMRWLSVHQVLSGTMLALVGHAGAAEGFQLPDAETIWPRWQARAAITLAEAMQTGRTRGPSQAALLGDYYVSRQMSGTAAGWRGGFRATSGVVLGHLGAIAQPGVQLSVVADEPGSTRETDLWPYLGLGYTGLAPGGGWGVSADLGLGIRGWERTLRRVDLTPMLQLGVRYTF